MKGNEGYAELERSYSRRWTLARGVAAAVSWTAAGALLGAGIWILFLSGVVENAWIAFPAALAPPVAAAAAAILRDRDAKEAVAWLDREIFGKQELLAAHEASGGGSDMEHLLLSEGRRIFEGFEGKPPLPSPPVALGLTAVFAAALFILAVLMGGTLLGPPEPEIVERGEALEAWAETWAERSGDSSRSESGELAERMGDIGRRMADGSLGARRSEQALNRMEAEILERRDGLVRDKLAESLVEDLGVEEETAEAFRVQQRRMPADALADLGRASSESPVFSEMEKEMIESLLSDPAFRDRRGDGSRELADRLADVLEDALDVDESGLEAFDEAVERSRKARRDSETPPSGDSGEGAAETEQGGPSPENRRSGSDDRGGSSETGEGSSEDSDPGDGESGGSGRGSTPMADEFGDAGDGRSPFGKEPMHLPSESERTGSWRTVIRAYSEEEGGGPVPDAELRELWRREAEAAIRREDIPPGTREFVKDYFTALEEGSLESNNEER